MYVGNDFDLNGFGMSSMERGMFSIVPIIVILTFVVVIGIFVVAAVRGAKQWHENNQSPILEVRARVVSRRTDVNIRHHHDADNMGMDHTTSSTDYYVTFEVTSGDRMEFSVSGREYGMLVEQDEGMLKFQGTRYLGFTRGAAEQNGAS